MYDRCHSIVPCNEVMLNDFWRNGQASFILCQGSKRFWFCHMLFGFCKQACQTPPCIYLAGVVAVKKGCAVTLTHEGFVKVPLLLESWWVCFTSIVLDVPRILPCAELVILLMDLKCSWRGLEQQHSDIVLRWPWNSLLQQMFQK